MKMENKNPSGSRIAWKIYELEETVTGNGAKTNPTIKNELSSASVVWSLKNNIQLLKRIFMQLNLSNESEIQSALISYQMI